MISMAWHHVGSTMDGTLTDVDFLNPPPPILPYMILDGYVLRYWSKQNQGRWHPADVSNRFQVVFRMTNITTAMLLWHRCTDKWSQCHSHRGRPWHPHRTPYHTWPWQWYQKKEKRVNSAIVTYSYDSAWKVLQSITMTVRLVGLIYVNLPLFITNCCVYIPQMCDLQSGLL